MKKIQAGTKVVNKHQPLSPALLKALSMSLTPPLGALLSPRPPSAAAALDLWLRNFNVLADSSSTPETVRSTTSSSLLSLCTPSARVSILNSRDSVARLKRDLVVCEALGVSWDVRIL